MTIFLTGDTHRDFDRIRRFAEDHDTTKDDIMIILGDAGINFYLNHQDDCLKKELKSIPLTMFMIHGNHEERPYKIHSYEEKEWHGGSVYFEEDYPNLLFAKDGEIYDLDGKKTIVIGGAYSVDKQYRLMMGAPWFASEQPDDAIKNYVESKLEKVNWKVDVVLSHTAPQSYEPTWHFIPGLKQSLVDKNTEKWLEQIEKKLDYERWYCGHYHCEEKSDKIRFMFQTYEQL